MNTPHQSHFQPLDGTSYSAIRITALALIGIFFLTLYPFRFSGPSATVSNPFLLGSSTKPAGIPDAVLNVLLFVPYGFGLAAQLKRRRNALATVAIAFATGALLSYAIEFLQLYIPQRDSGWNDVFTNSTGALIGALLFLASGVAVLRFLRRFEISVEAFATARNAAIALLVYFTAWFAASAHLERAARLSGWSPNAILLVGNSEPSRLSSAWKGEVYQLEFWNRALPIALARQLTGPATVNSQTSTALAAYDFSGSPPFADQNHNLPALDWSSSSTADDPPVVWNGAAWAATRVPVSDLVDDILKTHQFSVRLRCAPSKSTDVSAALLTISQPNGDLNMEVWQKNDTLEIWFQTPLTPSDRLVWRGSKIFVANQMRDFLFSYDSSKLSLMVDGQPIDTAYDLGPGPALAKFVRQIKAPELEGYRYLFYALVFFPAGSFLAVGWRDHPERISHLAIALAALVLAPVLLEMLLIQVNGQSISFENIALGLAAMCLGAIWINLGSGRPLPSQNSLQGSRT